MMVHQRTTISLDDGLLDQLKRRADEGDTTVSRLVEQAVRLFLRTPRARRRAEPFELVTFGSGGAFSHHNIDKTSALLEDEDVARYKARR